MNAYEIFQLEKYGNVLPDEPNEEKEKSESEERCERWINTEFEKQITDYERD